MQAAVSVDGQSWEASNCATKGVLVDMPGSGQSAHSLQQLRMVEPRESQRGGDGWRHEPPCHRRAAVSTHQCIRRFFSASLSAKHGRVERDAACCRDEEARLASQDVGCGIDDAGNEAAHPQHAKPRRYCLVRPLVPIKCRCVGPRAPVALEPLGRAISLDCQSHAQGTQARSARWLQAVTVHQDDATMTSPSVITPPTAARSGAWRWCRPSCAWSRPRAP
jgi:hypothetical protein